MFIIVTGAGRSGTSAVARVLHESGVSMGQRLRPPADANPVGYYEEMPVCDLNEQILFAVGMGEWHRWASRREILAAAAPFVPRMRELIADAYRHGDGPRGWKDPRFSWTIEAWLPYFPEKPRLVVCVRSPGEVVDSTMRVYGLATREARDAADEIWPNYYGRLLELIEDLQLEAHCVEYDVLLAEPEATVAGLAAFVGHPLDHRWVEPGLRRFAAPVPERYRDLYERVRRTAPRSRATRSQRRYPPASRRGPRGRRG